MILISQVKELFPISIEEERIHPHLLRADSDFSKIDFEGNVLDEVEAVGSKTIYYLAPLIWVAMSGKAREYAESIETFRDLAGFQAYWLKRSEDIRDRYRKENAFGGVSWTDI